MPVSPILSLTIPCYDEAATLPLLIQRIESAFGATAAIEVVLVDNGSSDATPEILRSLAGHPIIRTVRVDVNRGYGYGILAGLRVARGRFLGWTHGDLQADPGDAEQVLHRLSEPDAERLYFKGRRFGRPFTDVAFTIGMSIFETLLLREPLWDINAQPNIFSRAFFERVVDEAPHDFSLDLFFYYAARRHDLTIVRFPVRFGSRMHGISHWNVDWSAKKRFIARTMSYSFELRRRVRALAP